MNWNALIRMLTGMVIGKAVNRGIDYASRRGRDPATMTPEERARAASARKMAQRAKKVAKITRRLR